MAVLKEVPVRWVQIQAPDTRFDPQWSLDALLSPAQAKKLSAEAKKIHKKGVAIKKDEDGQHFIKLSRRVLKSDGSGENPAPRCIDATKTPVTSLVGNGSVCNIQYRMYPWDNKFGSGVGVDFVGMQVLSLVPYGGDADEFDVEEESEDDEFDTEVAEVVSGEEYDDDDFS